MSARQLQPTTDDEWPDWWLRLGLADPDLCARELATALVADPFEVLGFTALAVSYFRDDFGWLVELLAEREPVLRHALPAAGLAMRLPVAGELAQSADEAGDLKLPQWLCELDHLECTGIMRRYDHADRSTSSYLIETTLPGEHVSTARLSISHSGGTDCVSEFWTTGLSLRQAARFYRKRYSLHAARPYRNVKPETACRRILDALQPSLESDRLVQDWCDPTPWPQNVGVLVLLMRSLVAKLGDGHGQAPK